MSEDKKENVINFDTTGLVNARKRITDTMKAQRAKLEEMILAEAKKVKEMPIPLEFHLAKMEAEGLTQGVLESPAGTQHPAPISGLELQVKRMNSTIDYCRHIIVNATTPNIRAAFPSISKLDLNEQKNIASTRIRMFFEALEVCALLLNIEMEEGEGIKKEKNNET